MRRGTRWPRTPSLQFPPGCGPAADPPPCRHTQCRWQTRPRHLSPPPVEQEILETGNPSFMIIPRTDQKSGKK
jgi:hypothetical protein